MILFVVSVQATQWVCACIEPNPDCSRAFQSVFTLVHFLLSLWSRHTLCMPEVEGKAPLAKFLIFCHVVRTSSPKLWLVLCFRYFLCSFSPFSLASSISSFFWLSVLSEKKDFFSSLLPLFPLLSSFLFFYNSVWKGLCY